MRRSVRASDEMPAIVTQLEILDPWSQFSLPSPGATMLPVNVEIALGDGVRVQFAVISAVGTLAPNDSINHEVRNMDTTRRELARR